MRPLPQTHKSQNEGHSEALPQKWILRGFLCSAQIRVLVTANGQNLSPIYSTSTSFLKRFDAPNRYLLLGRSSGHKFAAWLTQQALSPSKVKLQQGYRREVWSGQRGWPPPWLSPAAPWGLRRVRGSGRGDGARYLRSRAEPWPSPPARAASPELRPPGWLWTGPCSAVPLPRTPRQPAGSECSPCWRRASLLHGSWLPAGYVKWFSCPLFDLQIKAIGSSQVRLQPIITICKLVCTQPVHFNWSTFQSIHVKVNIWNAYKSQFGSAPVIHSCTLCFGPSLNCNMQRWGLTIYWAMLPPSGCLQKVSSDTHHVGLHSLAIFRASLINILPSLIRANKADRLDGWIVTDEIHSCGKKTQWQPCINLDIV